MKETKQRAIPITKKMVYSAYKQVQGRKGSAGVDGVSLVDYEKNLSKNLYKLWNRLSSGSYFPPMVKEVSIPKASGGERKLGIPTVEDRIAQMVLKNHLEAKIDKHFHEHSYGYRPNKSAHGAIRQVRFYCYRKAWVIDLDIKGFFDNIDHELMLKALNRHIDSNRERMYVKRWLEASVLTVEGKERVKEGKGTPQGGVISPLLANLFLHYSFDLWFSKKYPHLDFVRYADDIIVHCFKEKQSREVLSDIQRRMKECKLELNSQKTKIVYCKNSVRTEDYPTVQFSFLGYSYQPMTCKNRVTGELYIGFDLCISKASRKRIVTKLRAMKIQKWITCSLQEVADRLNPKIRGWLNYYGKYRMYKLRNVFKCLHWRILKWLRKKYKGLKYSKRKAFAALERIRDENPNLFVHWKAGFKALG